MRQRATSENEKNESGIDRQVLERANKRSERGGRRWGGGTEEVNNRTLANCLGTRKWRRTKVQTSPWEEKF